MYLGERVKGLRERHGWTRAQLERVSGVQYNTIKRLEEGKHKSIRIFDGARLAKAFGLMVEKLLEGVDEPTPSKQGKGSDVSI
jgi:transcriptional regulator with XRE-family HTH domain